MHIQSSPYFSRWISILAVATTLLAACARTPLPAASPTASPAAQPSAQAPRAAATATPQPAATTAVPTATPVRSALVTNLVPGVQAQTGAGARLGTAVVGQLLNAGAVVRTDTTGRATLTFPEGSVARLGTDTTFEIIELSGSDADPLTRFRLALGEVLVRLQAVVGQGEYLVETPAGVASVRGSFLFVRYRPESDSTDVVCLETSGACTVEVNGITVTLQTGERITVVGGHLTGRPEAISREDLDEFQQELDDLGVQDPGMEDILATVFPNGTPTVGSTRTALPTVTNTPGLDTDTPRPPTATTTRPAPFVPPVVFPTATFTPIPTATNTVPPPTATKCIQVGTVPCV